MQGFFCLFFCLFVVVVVLRPAEGVGDGVGGLMFTYISDFSDRLTTCIRWQTDKWVSSWCFEPSQPQRITSGLTMADR